MPISISRYVQIASQVIGGGGVLQRDLIPRIFTTNPLLPTQSYLEFQNATAVGDYFGTSSAEYLRAQFYFSWVSKLQETANLLSFGRWADAATAPLIFGAGDNQVTLAAFNAINNGSFTLTIGPDTHTFSSLDFSASGSLAAVATAITNAINTVVSPAIWGDVVVSYVSAAPGPAFNLDGVDTGANIISVTDSGVGTDILPLLGWYKLGQTANTYTAEGAIFSNGVLAETITQTLDQSVALSNNFASFLFIPVLSEPNIILASQWTVAQNVSYIYSQGVLAANAETYSADLISYSGTGLTLVTGTTDYADMVPPTILGATDYTQANAVQNYMYQQFESTLPNALTPNVTTDTDANTYDGLRVNYYGQTQQAGIKLNFYQRGYLMGPSTTPQAMNVYANEIWLKDAATAALAQLLISSPQIPANNQGIVTVTAAIQQVIDQAVFNGTISTGKMLTDAQKAAVTGVTGDPQAWYQVQNIGYWLNVTIVPTVNPNNHLTEQEAVYTLVYSKDDVVNKIIGTHDLV